MSKNTAPNGVELLSPWDVEWFRNGHMNAQGNKFWVEAAKRNCTCRACGGTIYKGEQRLSGHYDFRGSGSWTSVPAHLHIVCPPTAVKP